MLVVEAADAAKPRLVLIDRYLRVEALRQLARDVVDALRLDLSEVDALLFAIAWKRADGGRRWRTPGCCTSCKCDTG